MSQPNQLPSPFEGKNAVNFRDEILRESFLSIQEASRTIDYTYSAVYPEVLAQIRAEILASLPPQPEQPVDYNQPLYVVPTGQEDEEEESAPIDPQPGDQLNTDDIRAQIEQIHNDIGGQQSAA